MKKLKKLNKILIEEYEKLRLVTSEMNYKEERWKYIKAYQNGIRFALDQIQIIKKDKNSKDIEEALCNAYHDGYKLIIYDYESNKIHEQIEDIQQLIFHYGKER